MNCECTFVRNGTMKFGAFFVLILLQIRQFLRKIWFIFNRTGTEKSSVFVMLKREVFFFPSEMLKRKQKSSFFRNLFLWVKLVKILATYMGLEG